MTTADPRGAEVPAREVGESAIRWLGTNLEWFEPGRWQEFLPRRSFPAGPLLELMVLLRCLRRGGFHEGTDALRGPTCAMANEVCRSQEFRLGLRKTDSLLPYHAFLLAELRSTGEPVGPALEDLELIAERDLGDVFSADRPVLTRMELRYALDLAGMRVEGLATPRELYDGSIAGCRDTALFFANDEIYALTHVLFYLTDFGAHPCGLDVARQRGVVNLVLTLLVACLDRDDFDLVGELLLCAEVLGEGKNWLVGYAWRAMAEAQRSDGAVPSPVHDATIVPRVHGEKRRAYVFGTCYHSTMVAAMAASEAVRRAAG